MILRGAIIAIYCGLIPEEPDAGNPRVWLLFDQLF